MYVFSDEVIAIKYLYGISPLSLYLVYVLYVCNIWADRPDV